VKSGFTVCVSSAIGRNLKRSALTGESRVAASIGREQNGGAAGILRMQEARRPLMLTGSSRGMADNAARKRHRGRCSSRRRFALDYEKQAAKQDRNKPSADRRSHHFSSVEYHSRGGIRLRLSSKCKPSSMRVTGIGGGPAGLYPWNTHQGNGFPSWPVRNAERNRPLDTFGWGRRFLRCDAGESAGPDGADAARITQAFATGTISSSFQRGIRSAGVRFFSGISRKAAASIFTTIERRSSVSSWTFKTDVTDIASERDRCDLPSCAEAATAEFRQSLARSVPADARAGGCRYVWLRNDACARCLHLYFPSGPNMDGSRVPCLSLDESSARSCGAARRRGSRTGLDRADSPADDCVFAKSFSSRTWPRHRLMTNSAHLRGRDWLNFTPGEHERWSSATSRVGRRGPYRALSVGSGTKLAMEDAIGLADALAARSPPVWRRARAV